MPTSWYTMDAKTAGGFENDEFSNWKSAFENDTLQSFAAENVLVYGDRPTNTPTAIRAVIQNKTADSYNTSVFRQILAPIGSILCGDLLKSADNRWWIVKTLVDNNHVYEKAIIDFCNYQLKFVSPTSVATVYTYPSVVHNATQYNSGERSTDYMTIVSSQRLVYLPCNEITSRIDNDFRFLMDKNTSRPSAWKVAQVDTENDSWEGHGLVRIMCTEDETMPSDNIANMLADNSKWKETHVDNITPSPVGGGWINL